MYVYILDMNLKGYKLYRKRHSVEAGCFTRQFGMPTPTSLSLAKVQPGTKPIDISHAISWICALCFVEPNMLIIHLEVVKAIWYVEVINHFFYIHLTEHPLEISNSIVIMPQCFRKYNICWWD